MSNGLIDRPEHLREVLERHPNAAFYIAAKHYAAERIQKAGDPDEAARWEGFDFVSKENSVREYCGNMFDLFDRAATTPNGVAMLQALEETELKRSATAYDVIDCLPDNARSYREATADAPLMFTHVK